VAAYSPHDAAAASGVLVPGTVTVYPAYRTNRVSILDAIDQPSASRNLSQNQLVGSFCPNYLALLGGADDEHLPGCVDDVRGDLVELVDLDQAPYLGHQAFDETEVPAGDAGDGVGGLHVVGVGRVVGVAQVLPVVGQDDRDVFGVDGPVSVGEADPAVQLRASGELTFEARHANQDHPEVGSVEQVAELFQGVRLEPIRLVDL